jgi:PTH2 family peptidyl-tRNA hydrolase
MKQTKQVIVVRKDLGMRAGKMCSQAAHASMAFITKNLKLTSFDHNENIEYYKAEFDINNTIVNWLENSFTKITCKCNSEKELLDLYDKAKAANITCSLIQDNGTTEFHGVKTYTAIAIGPDYSEKIDKITKDLQLL